MLPIIVLYFIFVYFKKYILQLIKRIKKNKIKRLYRNEFDKEIRNYKLKKTKVFFHLEIINEKNPIYTKFTVFNRTYFNLIPGEAIVLTMSTNNIIKSDLQKIAILSSEDDTYRQSFIFSVNLRQDNHYQVILDIQEEQTAAVEIVFYSKENDIPSILETKNFKIEYIEEYNNIPKIKRFNVVNIDINSIRDMYNSYANNKIADKAFESFSTEDLFIYFLNLIILIK